MVSESCYATQLSHPHWSSRRDPGSYALDTNSSKLSYSELILLRPSGQRVELDLTPDAVETIDIANQVPIENVVLE